MYIERKNTVLAATNLATLQQWMQEQLLYPRLTNEEECELHVRSSTKLTSRQHLAIYQRSYIARLRDCMMNQFPALQYALGQDLFLEFTDLYLSAYPSNSYTLGDLGERFARFLEETRPDKDEAEKESWPDFMIELAEFEFQVNIIFDEKANDKVNLAVHSTKDEVLKLAPVFHLFKFSYPISTFYKDAINDRKPLLPFPNENFSVLVRRDYRLGLFELNPSQYLFLSILKENQSVPEAKQLFASQFSIPENEMEEYWQKWKYRWIKEGFFCVQ